MVRNIKNSNLTKPIVSIIIPHLKNKNVLQECLSSLFRCDRIMESEIIVINNGQNEYMHGIKVDFPKIILVNPENNLGYAGGCNLGVKSAQSDLLLFLNDDTTHERKWINNLVESMHQNPDIGSLQPKILNHNDKNIFDYAGGVG